MSAPSHGLKSHDCQAWYKDLMKHFETHKNISQRLVTSSYYRRKTSRIFQINAKRFKIWWANIFKCYIFLMMILLLRTFFKFYLCQNILDITNHRVPHKLQQTIQHKDELVAYKVAFPRSQLNIKKILILNKQGKKWIRQFKNIIWRKYSHLLGVLGIVDVDGIMSSWSLAIASASLWTVKPFAWSLWNTCS